MYGAYMKTIPEEPGFVLTEKDIAALKAIKAGRTKGGINRWKGDTEEKKRLQSQRMKEVWEERRRTAHQTLDK